MGKVIHGDTIYLTVYSARARVNGRMSHPSYRPGEERPHINVHNESCSLVVSVNCHMCTTVVVNDAISVPLDTLAHVQ